MMNTLSAFLLPHAGLSVTPYYIGRPIVSPSPGLHANIHYFSHPEWAEEYLTYCHRSEHFKSRWSAALGDISNKIVVDIGCGPGNIFATITERPRMLIGVDVAPGSLAFASKLGYVPVLADAMQLPFINDFADIVTMNATLHHTEDMAAALLEAARILKPGGLLITDHDPQLSAWNYKGLAKLAWNARIWVYNKLYKRSFHKTNEQQHWGLACELHHKAGDGVTKEFFTNILEPAGFEVNIYPHNHEAGAAVLQGIKGKAALKYVLGNLLSGRNPTADESALSLMCIAKKTRLL